MRNQENRINSLFKLAIVLVVIVVVNWLAQQWFIRVDLTSEGRYTLSDTTKDFLSNLPEDVYVKVYLDGDLNVGFSKLSNATREMMEEFEVYGNDKLLFEFIDPAEGTIQEKKDRMKELKEYGLEPQLVDETAEDGRKIRSYVFPYALVYYNERVVGVNLLENLPGRGGAENLNISIESLEFKFADAFKRLITEEKPRIAFLEGHGELDELDVIEATDALSAYYQVDRGRIGNNPSILDPYKLVIVAKPSRSFSEKDKFILDQYLMNGGRLLFFVDAVNVTLDSLRRAPQTMGLYADVNLQDQLFKYGVRINPVIVEDIQAGRIMMNVSPKGQPKLVPFPWLYSPLMATSPVHAITRNVNLVRGDFTSTIDTVGRDLEVSREVLLRTSQLTKVNQTPVFINMMEVNQQPDRKAFNHSFLPTAIAQEGYFPSVFQNRQVPAGIQMNGKQVKVKSQLTRMVVVADGDIIKNEVRFKDSNPQVQQLGFDEGSKQVFGNKDFIVNAVNYLCDDEGWMALRGRNFTLRLLDREQLSSGTIFWKWLNVGAPVLLIIIGSVVFLWIRKRKYGK
ncbi:MAG: gliding motility-associated ABC transporter substrate-binding protein GldG [Marinilabiliaceae bacterium]|nr:gliding motility-associated ABC transporter substrate-binding protein GldG [Marinilabiliaceae bacterium]